MAGGALLLACGQEDESETSPTPEQKLKLIWGRPQAGGGFLIDGNDIYLRQSNLHVEKAATNSGIKKWVTDFPAEVVGLNDQKLYLHTFATTRSGTEYTKGLTALNSNNGSEIWRDDEVINPHIRPNGLIFTRMLDPEAPLTDGIYRLLDPENGQVVKEKKYDDLHPVPGNEPENQTWVIARPNTTDVSGRSGLSVITLDDDATYFFNLDTLEVHRRQFSVSTAVVNNIGLFNDYNPRVWKDDVFSSVINMPTIYQNADRVVAIDLNTGETLWSISDATVDINPLSRDRIVKRNKSVFMQVGDEHMNIDLQTGMEDDTKASYAEISSLIDKLIWYDDKNIIELVSQPEYPHDEVGLQVVDAPTQSIVDKIEFGIPLAYLKSKATAENNKQVFIAIETILYIFDKTHRKLQKLGNSFTYPIRKLELHNGLLFVETEEFGRVGSMGEFYCFSSGN